MGTESHGVYSFVVDENESEQWVAVVDQASSRVIVYDSAVADWNDADAVKWEWAPTSDNGFAGLEQNWGNPSDVKLRTHEQWGGQWMIVTASLGLAAVVPYPAGDSKRWGLNVGGNPHSIELLPNGNVAVAASQPGWVRIYAASQGPDADTYVEYPIEGAHGVQWDPQREWLWAIADEHIVALRITGTDTEIGLEEVRKTKLPTVGGHDLQPVHGNTDRFWVTTNTGVYQYVKSADTFDSEFSGFEAMSRIRVKSIGNWPNGQILSVVPDHTKRSMPESFPAHVLNAGARCTLNEWSTDTIDFYADIGTRTIDGAAIYKARIWNSRYE